MVVQTVSLGEEVVFKVLWVWANFCSVSETGVIARVKVVVSTNTTVSVAGEVWVAALGA